MSGFPEDATKTNAAGLGSVGGIYRSTNNEEFAENSANAQRSRMLAWLKERPITTLQARRLLDVMQPAPRIFELRARGYNIVTLTVLDFTGEGRPHNVAKYVLMPEAANGD